MLKQVFELDFAFSHSEEDKWKVEEYKKKAREIIQFFLEGKSVGLVADTGTGKTDIAFLALVPFILLKNFRILFLTPQRLLSDQQHKAFLRLTEKYNISATMITGKIQKKKRIWNNPETKIVFATPQVITEEIVKKFNIVVFDEFHHATGKYTYVPIAENAAKHSVLRFGLSASPGETKEDIGEIQKTLAVDTFLTFLLRMPPKFEENIKVEMDDTLKKVDAYFVAILKSVEDEMAKATIRFLKKSTWTPFSEKELKIFEEEIKKWKGVFEEFFIATSLLAEYRKIRHSYFICMTEGYKTFLEYVKKLEKDTSKAANKIINNTSFRKIIELTRTNFHPKATAFKKFIEKFPENGTAVIFVGQKDTGRIILEYLKNQGKKVDFIFGGTDKDEKKQEEKLKALRERKIHFLISTSVLHEGIHVPEINYVINFSIPRTAIARIQSKGRVGRTMPGHVINFFLNHSHFDSGTFFSTLRSEKKMKQLINPAATQKRARLEQIAIAFSTEFS